MKFKLTALAVGIGLSLACDSGPKDGFDTAADTGDLPTPGTDPFEQDPFITAVTAECNGSTWTFEIESDFWMYNATVAIFDTSFSPAWDEEHVLDPIEHDDNGLWDVWGNTYADGATAGTFNPDTNSVFNCTDHPGFITYVFQAYNEAGQVADCVVIGDDPGQIINGTWPVAPATDVNGTNVGQYSGCENIN